MLKSKLKSTLPIQLSNHAEVKVDVKAKVSCQSQSQNQRHQLDGADHADFKLYGPITQSQSPDLMVQSHRSQSRS
jgi:hypothetical protein